MYNQYYQNPLTYGRQDYMQQAQQVPASYGLKGRPVSSFEEARAALIWNLKRIIRAKKFR